MVSLLHTSDIHFGPPHRPAAARALHDLCEERSPDALVISGDLTQRAKPYQFRQAREFLSEIPVPAIAVPGNHDVPMYRVWERALAPYGVYRKHFSADLEPRLQVADAWLAGINTAYNWTRKGGRVTAASLARLRADAARVDAGLVRIVVAHHPLLVPKHFAGERRMRGDGAVVSCFNELGIELVLSGHAHQFFLGRPDEFGHLGDHAFVVLHSGTSSSNRWRGEEAGINSCNWVEVKADEIAVEHLRYREGDRRRGAFEVHARHTWRRAKGVLGRAATAERSRHSGD